MRHRALPRAARTPVRPGKQARPAAPGSKLWGRDARGGLFPAALITLLIAIMVVPQGLDYSGEDFMPTSSDLLSRTVWLVLLGGSLFLLVRFYARTVAFVRSLNPFLLLFAALATMSIAWSIDPGVTIRRVGRVYTILMVCVSFTLVGWHRQRFQNTMRMLLTALLAASVIFVKTSPELAIHHAADHAELIDAWRGITTGKNILGSLASAAFLFWLHAWLSKEAHRLIVLCGAALAMTCLIMSRSSTSVMATAFAAVFMLILLRSPGSMRPYMPYFIGLFATLMLAYALAVLHLVPGMDALLKPIAFITGKDQTFTGRTNIWYILHLHIRLHPWLGTGYGAYWVGPLPTSPSYEMVNLLYFYPTEGHNGYMDIVNDLGLVGGCCLLGYLVNYLRTSLAMMKLDRYQAGLYLTLLFRGFVADMSESHWLSVLSVDFVIMTMATTALTRSLIQVRLDRAARSASLR